MKRFQSIDTDGSGMIDCPEFEQVLGLPAGSRHGRLMFDFFDTDLPGSVDFREIATGMMT